jgi:hypothetical protein
MDAAGAFPHDVGGDGAADAFGGFPPLQADTLRSCMLKLLLSNDQVSRRTTF